jgi:hypothetical protein
MKTSVIGIALLSAALIAAATPLEAQLVSTKTALGDRLEIRNVYVKDNVITGEVTNRSPRTVRNVELLFQYHWLWRNEFKPGENNPGNAFYVVLDREIRPGESASFRFAPDPPLPSRNDGEFMTEVSIAGFSEVIPQTRASAQ